MEKRYLLGLDIGTSAVKAALFEKAGGNRPVGVTSATYPIYYPAPGCVEQEPEDWWRAIVTATRELLRETGVDPDLIAGIGIDGQSWAAVAVDAEGRVLAPTPIWQDTRTADICAELTERLGTERVRAGTLCDLQPGFTFPKILWYKRNLPEVYEKAVAFLQSNAFAVLRLTDRLSQDLSQSSCMLCVDIVRGVWDEALCREAGVDPALLPPLYAPHEIVGTVTERAARETGLAVGTPVVAGGMDTPCDALGAGVVRVGECQELGGQSGGMNICLDAPLYDPRLLTGRHVVPDRYLLQGGTVGGGAILRWFSDTFEGGNSDFARLDREASTVPAGAEGLVLLPYFAGERTPLWDPDAKGVYYGLTYSKTRAHFHRANLEAAAYALRHNLEVAREAGANALVLRASGGAAKSPLWTQIKADVTGAVIEVPQAFSTACFGAAVLAGVGTGFYASFDEAVAGITLSATYTPDPQTREVYDKTYRTYRAIYEGLSPVMHQK
ncbi:MAG: FGGY-family carbohydrate kinase [Clostridia bacterium]|nr:FGGY-family carbohydrate kinase [Clostridia bacterium]